MVRSFAALVLCATAHALLAPSRPSGNALRTRLNFLSPEMSGALAKMSDADNYEKIVSETMVKEDCDRDEAERRYNQYLFDPDGYSIMKMNEQIRNKGFSSFEEMFVAENGQDAWDARQASIAESKSQKGTTSIFVVGGLFLALVAAKTSGVVGG
mmetsp:Transcript_9078/g.28374  ORF Transcript_9078/g.28374 Transcript_9078/m.28374 type:complete len:155 (-) Transcript_9078:50-514(-)